MQTITLIEELRTGRKSDVIVRKGVLVHLATLDFLECIQAA